MRWVVVGVLLVTGCIAEPKDGTPWTPPDIYHNWYARTEQCSGRQGALERIHWYTMPGETFNVNGDVVEGVWYPDHRIYLAAHDTMSGFIVRHEMLHDLLGGDPHHRNPAFRECRLLRDR